ncbi:MAG: hypothetical protein ACOCX4_00140 [Planctomycetota bacterium]
MRRQNGGAWALVIAIVAAGAWTRAAAAAETVDAPQGRPRVALAGAWEMQFVAGATDAPNEDGAWQEVDLPRRIRLKPRNEEARDAVWLRRTVTVPADWAGRRIVLNIHRVQYACAVHVDGEPVGEAPAYGAVLDLTDHLTPGEAHEFRLRMGRKGMGHPVQNRAVADLVDGIQAQVDHGGWDRGVYQVGLSGPGDLFYLESRPTTVTVEDVWYRTATRGLVRIEPEVTIHAAAPTAGLTATLRVYAPDAAEPVLEHAFPLGTLEAGRNVRRALVSAEQLQLWDIGQPNLYRGQVVITDADGAEVDRSTPTVFGVREFWIQGRHTMLNNHPVHLVIDWGKPAEKAPLGSNLIEPSIPWEANHLGSAIGTIRTADRLGVAVEAHGVIHHLIDVGDPAIAEDYQTWWRARYRQIRNHPSVFFYGLGINSPGNFMDFNPWKIGQRSNLAWSNVKTTLAYQLHKDAAPEAAFYFHGGPRGGDVSTGNLYMNHIPTQEVEDWFSIWAESGDMPVMLWEGMSAPLHVDYKKGGLGLATEFNAIRYGPRAYAEETDAYLAYCNYVLSRLKHWDNKVINHSPLAEASVIQSLTRGNRAWRYFGAPFKSWAWTYDNEAILEADHATRAPNLAWIGGPVGELTRKDHNYTSGDRIEKSACLIHDRADHAHWTLAWRLTRADTGAVLLERGATAGLGPFGHSQEAVRFDAPAVDAPTALKLALTVTDADTDQTVATDTLGLTIYPPRPAERDALSVTILDPRGDTTRMLKKRGVNVTPLRDGETPADGVLVIGREALSGRRTLPYTAGQIADGLRVVVFEQHCRPLGALGFRHEDMGPRQVFARMPEHPVVADLQPEALRDWRGDGTLHAVGARGDRQAVGSRLYHCLSRGTVASSIIETPQHGPFRTLLDCEFDLNFSPLVIWPHGKGEIVFCQLDVTGRMDLEPAATQILDQLVTYLAAPRAHMQDRTVRCLSDAACDAVDAIGFAAAPLADALDPAADVLLVRAEDAAALAAHRKAMTDFLNAGGDVLALYADETLLADPLFGAGWTVETVDATRAARTVDAHPLLAGVGPQNIHWRMPVRMRRITATPNGATTLLGGYAAVRPVGKGRLVLLQVDPAAFDDATAAQEADPHAKDKPLPADRIQYMLKRSRWHTVRLHSLLLANLGVQSSDLLADRLTAMRWSIPMKPIDRWVFFGPFAPGEKDQGDPLEREDLDTLASNRDLRHKGRNARGETMMWHVPNDAMHGMGVNGEIELSDVFGVRLRDIAVAVTHVWSSRPRTATIESGADWWLRIDVNGKQVRRTKDGKGFGVQFGRPTQVALQQGWNEIRVVCAAGSNGHVFWFRMTDPGDLVVAQSPTAPDAPPGDLPPLEDLLPEEKDTSYSLYQQRELKPSDDPYSFVPW